MGNFQMKYVLDFSLLQNFRMVQWYSLENVKMKLLHVKGLLVTDQFTI